MKELAEKKGVLPIQIALAWVMHKPGVTSPIIGARTIRQMKELVDSATVELTAEDQEYLETPYIARPVLGHS